MKTSDIPERPILEFLAKHQGEWCNWFFDAEVGPPNERSVVHVMKLVLSKMKTLIRRGLATGCDCGCRGDFEITDKGLEHIGGTRTAAMICPTTEAEKQFFLQRRVMLVR